MNTKELLEYAMEKLVAAYQPLAIYLFGSRAWGEPNQSSDFDFMVIVNDEATLERPESYRGYLALANFDAPKDILINRKTSFLKRAAHPSTLQHKVLKEGIKIYGNI